MSRYISLPIELAIAFSATILGLASTSAADTKPAVAESAKVVRFDRDEKSICEGLPGCDFILLAGDPGKGAT